MEEGIQCRQKIKSPGEVGDECSGDGYLVALMGERLVNAKVYRF